MRPEKSRKKVSRKEGLMALLFIFPSLFILNAVGFFPLILSLLSSFFRWSMVKTGLSLGEFVGLTNYVSIFTERTFLTSLKVTFIYVTCVLVIEFFLGLALALSLTGNMRGKGLFRTIVLTPLMLTPVVVGLAWRLIFEPSFGIMNYFFEILGLPRINWLGDPRYALPAVIIVDIWQWTPFIALVLMAGLESIPLDIYEAAEVDGASRRAKFFSITLPLLKPAIFVALMFRIADAFKAFDTILMITRGGPAGSTETLTLWIYKVAFSHLELGMTSAASYILMLIVLPPVLILTRLLTGKEGLSALLRR